MERQFIFRHRELTVGAESFDLEVTPTNFGINKPIQAVWSSSLIEFNNQLPETGWSQWCEAEEYGNIEEAKVFELKFKEEPKLIVVKTYKDLVELNDKGLLSLDNDYITTKQYGIINYQAILDKRLLSIDSDYITTKQCGVINYQAILDKGYDGIRVTANAILESRGLRFSDEHVPIYVNFSAWDCESTCWVTNRCFKEYKYLGIYRDLLG